MDEKLLKLNTLLQAIKKDVVTPRDIEGFVAVFLEEVKKTKDSLEVITEEKLAYLDNVLKQFEEKRADILKGIDSSIEEREKYLTDEFGNSMGTITASVSSEITPLREVLSESIKEAKSIIKQLKKVKIKDGKDADEELIVDRVLEKIVLPEYKDVVLDSGEQIVDKINALNLSEENKIDASHIKNLPTPKGGYSPTVLGNATDLNQSARADGYAIVWDDTNKNFKFASGGGGGGTPAGSNGELQFNDNGVFGGMAGITYENINGALILDNALSANALFQTSAGTGVRKGIVFQIGTSSDNIGAGFQLYAGEGLTAGGDFTIESGNTTNGAAGTLFLKGGLSTNGDDGLVKIQSDKEVYLTDIAQTKGLIVDTLNSNALFVFPVTDGAAGDSMVTNGSGVLSFEARASKSFAIAMAVAL
jgi:hypothetical protein